MTILDASAVLGLIQGERRASSVVHHLADAAISAVNHAEVIGKLVDVGMPASIAAGLLPRLHIEVVPFTQRHALIAGELRPVAAHLGLSVGDRACLATALVEGDTAVTLDRAWADLDIGIPIVLCS